jgi:nucleotide-binding universal stress UspA family protein
MKTTKVQQILVYTDFTTVGEKSLEWAIFFAKQFEKELFIVHVINENSFAYFSKSNAEDEAKDALAVICDNIYSEHKIRCQYFVEEGCTCTIINSNAERIDAFFVVLGTHGKNDPQFLSGTAAVKIIRKSRIPYFVVQKNTLTPDSNKHIVLPLDFRKEMKEKTGWVSFFSKHLKTDIEIIFQNLKDDRLEKNLFFCTKFFNKLELTHHTHELVSSYENINSKAVKFAVENGSLLIVIITTKDETFIHKIFGFPETKTIANTKGIPVLCINPKKDLFIPCI